MASWGILWGAIIVCSRGLLLLAPAATLRGFRAMIRTDARTRTFGTCLVLLAVPAIWAGTSENSTLATVLLFIGWTVVGICIPALVLFPRVYMNVAEASLPADSITSLFGWRVVGLLGVVIGATLFWFGLLAL